MNLKIVFKRLLLKRLNIQRNKFLINNNNWFWKLSYRQRRILYCVVHPLRSVMLFRLKHISVNTKNDITLKPFVDSNSIFVRIPKSAGRSVSTSLYNCLVGSHITIRDFQIVFNESEFNHFYKFCIVRNPWDRLVSAYLFLKEGGVTGNDKIFSNKYLEKCESFDEFVKKHLRKRAILNFTHFRPQTEFITIQKRLCVDFIGRFEQLDDDFEIISKKIGTKESVKLSKINITNSRKEHGYKESFSKETLAIVEEVYKDDIELLNYTF